MVTPFTGVTQHHDMVIIRQGTDFTAEVGVYPHPAESWLLHQQVAWAAVGCILDQCTAISAHQYQHTAGACFKHPQDLWPGRGVKHIGTILDINILPHPEVNHIREVTPRT